MPTSSLPLDIKIFIKDRIDSVTHLEVLLMLFNEPDRIWSPEYVSKVMRTNNSSASNQLTQLVSKGLIKEIDSRQYKYSPDNQELHQLVTNLNEIYKEKPVAVVTCIFERPQDKLRDLSDAFKLKKD